MRHHLSSLLSLLLALLPLIPALPVFPRQTIDLTTTTLKSPFCIAPAPWNTIFSFFLTNYVARIATIKKTSGSQGKRGYINALMSLFVPFLGISVAANTIARGSRFFGSDDVDRALLAEALCVIVREGDWQPMHGEIIRGCKIIDGDRRELRKKRRRQRRNQRRAKEMERVQVRGSEKRLHRFGREDDHAYSAPPSEGEDDDNSDMEDDFSKNAATLVVEAPYVTILDREDYKIQGHMTLPPNYALALLPPGTELMALAVSNAVKSEIVISNSYGVVKAFTGMVQIVSSLYTLYTAYGQQIERYGYAAFGFTVLPYTIMSILNVCANLVEASYDCLFLVRSDVMLEAEHREEGEFIGEVAELKPADSDEIRQGSTEYVDLQFLQSQRGWKAYQVDENGDILSHHQSWKVRMVSNDGTTYTGKDPRAKIIVQPLGRPLAKPHKSTKKMYKIFKRFQKWSVTAINAISLIIPYAVIGGFSKFKRGRSTRRQQVFMVGWLVVGQFIGALNIASLSAPRKGRKRHRWELVEWVLTKLVISVGVAFAIGGFVESGKMMKEFGYCIKIPGEGSSLSTS